MGQVFKTKRGSAWHEMESRAEGAQGVTEADAICGEQGRDPKAKGLITVIDGPVTCKNCIRERAERDRLKRGAQERTLDLQGVGAGKVAADA